MPLHTFDRKKPIAEQRLAIASQKIGGAKNHGTGKRTAAVNRHKRNKAAMSLARTRKQQGQFKAQSKRFWRGEWLD